MKSSKPLKPLLPLLPYLSRFPFLKVSGRLFELEYGSIENFLTSQKSFDVEARQLGFKIVESVLKDEKFPSDAIKQIELSFFCEVCETRGCREACKKGAMSFSWNYMLCDMCGECFLRCDYSVSDELYFRLKTIAKLNVAAYLYSRILVSLMDERARRRYAVREARKYREIMDESDATLMIFASDFGLKAKIEENVNLHVSDYLKAACRIRSKEWKLVNRKLKKGYVELTRKDFLRIVEELLRTRLAERVMITPTITPTPEINRNLAELIPISEARFAEIELGEFDAECLPPCMKKILSDLQAGLNVPHSARFAITSFLLNIGLSVDEVISLFSSAPDFDVEKTRYQVEHIAGARGTEYTAPACDTMLSYHNCYRNDSCRGVNHPVNYYRRCKKASKASKGDKKR
jgi:DNA primase large subunit